MLQVFIYLIKRMLNIDLQYLAVYKSIHLPVRNNKYNFVI